MYDSINPGQPWLDTSGKRIQAHGAGLFHENGTYYWYGENKEHTDGKSKVWTSGIRCYSSSDFYNWTDQGLIIPPDTGSRRSPLHPTRRIDRPHILFNASTGKYVCWLKEIEKGFHLLTSPHLLGPYTLVKPDFRPLGKAAGDFDLAQDEETGKAFLYFASKRDGVYLAELTDDYLDVTGRSATTYQGIHPPFTREGVTHLQRDGRHYLITSGMTGYLPNPSEVAVADDWLGPYTVQGDPHVDDDSCASFNSQVSYAFKHPTIPDLWIALADRWVPDYPITRERHEWLTRLIGSTYYRDRYRATMKEKLALLKTPMMAKANTSVADYVWLPITWDGDRLQLRWRDEWRIDDFA